MSGDVGATRNLEETVILSLRPRGIVCGPQRVRGKVCIARSCHGVFMAKKRADERDAWARIQVREGIVTDLVEAGYVVKDKDGRRNRYRIGAHHCV